MKLSPDLEKEMQRLVDAHGPDCFLADDADSVEYEMRRMFLQGAAHLLALATNNAEKDGRNFVSLSELERWVWGE